MEFLVLQMEYIIIFILLVFITVYVMNYVVYYIILCQSGLDAYPSKATQHYADLSTVVSLCMSWLVVNNN